MAAYGVSFESSSSIEEKKENKRQARQEAIEKVQLSCETGTSSDIQIMLFVASFEVSILHVPENTLAS